VSFWKKLFGGGPKENDMDEETRFRIVPNDNPLRPGMFAIRFDCGQCGKQVQVPVGSIMGSGANVRCHSCGNITYVPPNAGKG
jgi:transcription elongation factor Elf1